MIHEITVILILSDNNIVSKQKKISNFKQVLLAISANNT
jgi:hypothetical protein